MTLFSYAQEKIPLPEGMDQTGYIARHGGSVGVLDQPMIKVILLKESLDAPSILVFCDLLGLSPARTRLYEELLSRLCGTNKDKVVITCTHTHCAPAAMSLLLLGECRDSWFYDFELALVGCVKRALDKPFEEVAISFAKTPVNSVTRNRVVGGELEVDTEESVLRFETASMRLLLVNYACHPVTKNADCRLYSRDFPSVIERELLEGDLADAFIFATGPCGDLNPIFQDLPGEHVRMEEYGKKLADGVRRLLASDDWRQVRGFDVQKCTVHLPLITDHERSDATTFAAESAKKHAAANELQEQKYQEANYLYALSRRLLSRYRLEEEAFTATLAKITFGPLTILGVPFELFSDVGLNLKREFAPACVWELCGGNYGYFPSDARWDAATYERGDAYMYYNRGGPLQKGSEARLTAALKQL